MSQYLKNSEFINWKTPEIEAVARDLKADFITDIEISKACFEYVIF